MKLIYVHATQILAPSPGNTFIFFKSLAMAQLGHEVHLVCMKDIEGSIQHQIEKSFGVGSLPDNFKIHTFFKKGRGHFQFYRFAIGLIRKIVCDQTYIWTRTMGFVPHLVWANRKLKCPVFFESHDCFYDLQVRNDIDKARFRKHSLIEKHLFKRLSGLLTLTSDMKKIYHEKWPELPIHVTSGGLNKIYPSNEIKLNKFVYVGSLDPHKGVATLVPLIKALRGDFEFLIVGARNDSEKERAEGYFSEHEVLHRVKVYKWMDKNSLNTLLSQCKFGLLPLQDTFFNRHLTSPLKCFDYMAHGLPVLTSDWPCLRDLIQSEVNGYFINWDQPLAQQLEMIETLLENDLLFQEMSKKVRGQAEKFLWQNVAQRQLDFFKTI